MVVWSPVGRLSGRFFSDVTAVNLIAKPIVHGFGRVKASMLA